MHVSYRSPCFWSRRGFRLHQCYQTAAMGRGTNATKAGVSSSTVGALLALSAAEYAVTDFSRLHARICDALRGDRPRFVGESMRADGRTTLVYEDGTSRVIEAPVEVSSS